MSNGTVQVPIDVHVNDKFDINGSYANETKLKVKHLLEEDGGSYWCRAAFPLGESEEHIKLVVLSFMVPLKPFLAIIAEVILLVAIILLCEVYTQKKKNDPDDGKEFEQIEQLKSDDSNGIENNVPRYRKTDSGDQWIQKEHFALGRRTALEFVFQRSLENTRVLDFSEDKDALTVPRSSFINNIDHLLPKDVFSLCNCFSLKQGTLFQLCSVSCNLDNKVYPLWEIRGTGQTPAKSVNNPQNKYR